jgi:radical SAM protein with 4Fe4S-binding SPASM domain
MKRTQKKALKKLGAVKLQATPGHDIRTHQKLVDRSSIGQGVVAAGVLGKLPNQYTGPTFKNKERFKLDGHKLLYHRDIVERYLRGERVAPITIDMGLTKFCNMGCIYCIGVTQGMARGAMIAPEALMRFINDCGRLGVKGIAFIGDGEPTLNPAMTDAAVRAHARGIDIGIGTNGLALDMKRAGDLLKACSFIRFNISAATRQAFSRVHQTKPQAFDVITDNIATLVRLKKEKGYACTIGLQMVLIPENFDQVVRLGHLGAKLGADYLQVKQCSDTEYKELGIEAKDYAKATAALKEVEALDRPDYTVTVKWNKINVLGNTEVYRQGFRKYDICYGTPLLGQVSGNGKVYPCGPFFGKDRFYMGDIHETSYYDIVNSDRYWKVHEDIQKNVDVHCDCTVGCRQDYINKFLWDLKNPPDHINFV